MSPGTVDVIKERLVSRSVGKNTSQPSRLDRITDAEVFLEKNENG